MIPKILALDFDGTLCSMDYPYIGKRKWPHKIVLWWAKRLQKRGWCIILNTCRAGDYVEQALTWLKQECAFIPDYVNEHHPLVLSAFTHESRKIGADLYIDDRNIGFIGWFLRRF